MLAAWFGRARHLNLDEKLQKPEAVFVIYGLLLACKLLACYLFINTKTFPQYRGTLPQKVF